jgi:tetratricopeptide (TPR) repeat protein
MRAIDLVHQALADLQAVGDERGIARCMSIIASLAALRGEYKAAWRAYEEALRLHTEQVNQRGVGIALAGMGVLARHLGNLDQAESLSEQAQHMLHEVGDANGLARASLTIATVERARGNLPRALELARENLSRFQALGDREEIAECLEVLAGTIAVLGDLERAARLFGAAEALLETMGTTPPHTARYQYADDVAALRKRLGPAAADEAWAAGRALLPDVAIAEALDVVSLNQLPTATSVTG